MQGARASNNHGLIGKRLNDGGDLLQLLIFCRFSHGHTFSGIYLLQ